MKVILYISTTINGLIAKLDGNSDWVSTANAKDFYPFCQNAGAVIMGRKTYDLLSPSDLPLKKGVQKILTRNQNLKSEDPTVEFTKKSPKDIVSELKTRGCKSAVVIGGTETVSLFLEANLIDEIILVIEPLFFSKGMPIFSGFDFEKKLELLEVKHLRSQTIQLHYKVLN